MGKFIPLDYSKNENWLINEEDKGGTDYDVIFFLGTSIFKPSQENGIGDDFALQRKIGMSNYKGMCTCLCDNARAFIPLQRQLSLEYALQFGSHDTLIEKILETEAFADVSAALDYYFEHYNNGRPFVIGGHSQGGCTCQAILEAYFLKTEKRELLKRMVVMASLGYGVSKKWFNSLPNREGYIHLATGEDDYHSIITWNVEGVGEKRFSFLLADDPYDTYVINPLNWKTDETYASKKENKGVLITSGNAFSGDYETHESFKEEDLFDAKINLKRGSVETSSSTDFVKIPLYTGEVFGGKSLHNYDGAAFYQNIKQNIRLRLNKYLKENK